MQRHANDWRGQIDEPVGQNRGHPQKEHVVEQAVTVLLDVPGPFARFLWPKVSDETAPDQIGERIAECGAQRRAEANEKQCDGEFVQESK